MISDPAMLWWLNSVLVGRCTSSFFVAAILGTSPERGVVWRVWRPPRIDERRAEWRVGGPRARVRGVQQRKWRGPRVLGCFGLGAFMSPGGRFWMRQHCGVGSCAAMALSVWWCLSPSSSIKCWITSEVSMPTWMRL
jgi:hypothetical protein